MKRHEPDPLKRMARQFRKMKLELLNGASLDEFAEKYKLELAFLEGLERLNESHELDAVESMEKTKEEPR